MWWIIGIVVLIIVVAGCAIELFNILSSPRW